MKSVDVKFQKAVSVLLVLAVLFLLGIAFGLLFPAIQGGCGHCGYQGAAKNDLMQTITALRAFHTEYGRFPRVGQLIDGDLEISGTEQRKLYNILQNKETQHLTLGEEAQNSRGIVFFEGRVVKKMRPKAGFGEDGIFYDPWGGVYQYVLDANGDGSVKVPTSWNCADSGQILDVSVIGFSPGKKTGADPQSQRDDVTTW